MAIHVSAQIRIGSTVDQFSTIGQTEPTVRNLIKTVPMPEGPTGESLRTLVLCTQVDGHEAVWGVISIVGDTREFNDGEKVLQWWKGVNLAIGNHAYMSEQLLMAELL